jgi:isopentenyl-diphosphate Delta-isomerase
VTDDEPIDLVDPSGRPLGIIKPRSDVHRLGLWHGTVHVWIVNRRGMLLFQKRSLSKESFPGLWDVSAAGHISSGEPAVLAAQREVRQELGVHVEESDLCFLFTLQTSSVQCKGTFIDNEFNNVYLVRRDLLTSELKLQASEVSDVMFLHHGELERLAAPGDLAFAPHPDEYARLFEHLARS